MNTNLDWQTIFSETQPLRSRSTSSDLSPINSINLSAIRDLPETPAVPLDQMGIWTNAPQTEALIHIVAGASFARLSETGIVLIEPRIFSDHRGLFFEAFHTEKFATAGIPTNFVQDNHSLSHKNVLRGLHYQIQQPQGKLIRCHQRRSLRCRS